MKITIYTVSDCQFSKAEKEYLASHNLPFEEKNLEQNREWLSEMLTISNNFAGTPVTKIEKDDDQIIVLKGFTKEEFDKALNITTQESSPAQTVNQTTPTPQTTSEPPQQPPSPPAQPTQQTSQTSSTIPSVNQSPASPSLSNQPLTNTSSTSTQPNDPLNSILNELQKKVNENNPNQPSTPYIPDFPAKD